MFFWWYICLSGVDSKEDNRKEYLALNLVMSDQPMSEVKVLSSNINNQTSSDHNIKPQKVPIAMAEVDIEFKTPEDEQQEKKVKCLLFCRLIHN